jgi:hypothetical protein
MRRGSGCASNQHRGMEALVVQAQPAGDLPGDITPQRTDRPPIRQALQACSTITVAITSAGTDGCPPPWRATSANSPGGNSWWRWSARKAYTDPSGIT